MSYPVVTGGAGFIGSAIVRALLAQGAGRVTVIDSLCSGKESNLAEVREHVDLHVADIRDYSTIAPLLRAVPTVFHLAAIPSVPRSITEPVPSHESNIDGTFNVLRAASEGKCGRVVYAASSSAYGDTEVLPKVETMAPKPLSPYALQKLVGEYYGSVFWSCYGLPTVSLRFFNVFGPRQDPTSPYSGVLSIFMSCLLDRRSPTIFGDGEQSRDFTYVEDVARSLPQGFARARFRLRQILQRRQWRPHHSERNLACLVRHGRRRNSLDLFGPAPRRRPRFPGRHHRRRA